MSVNDAILIASIRNGDAAAERALYDAHVDRVFRLAHRMTGDAMLAEDATQDTFIRVFDRLGDYRGDGPLGGWVHRVATTVILGHLRKRKRVRTWEQADDELVAAAGAAPADDPVLRRRLDRAVADLDDSHRLVFVMHDMEGYTHQEIAAAMGTPVGTAKARLSRARARLRALLLGPGPAPVTE
jgi:RNA polymerase sigma-70 factor (ECF subfamily)